MNNEEKTAIERRIENVKALPLRRGKQELLTHLEGSRNLTLREAALAHCFGCMNGYDEAVDCRVPACTLHPWMPYREGGVRKSRTMSDEQRQASADRLSRVRREAAE